MDCLPVTKLPEGEGWSYEVKLDGHRLEAVRSGAKTTLYSGRRDVLNEKFDYIAAALEGLPDGTILDGELVALDDDGIPNFDLLQNFRSAQTSIVFYVFDILMHKGRDMTARPLWERRHLLRKTVQNNLHVVFLEVANLPGAEMLKFVRERGLEGVVAKRTNSVYQPGQRTGLWRKYRINLGQEFVIGGYVPSNLGIGSLVVGFYRGDELIYASRVRAGFVASTRLEVFEKIKHLRTPNCPFTNLPEPAAGRWGQGFTAEKMKNCVWLLPKAVARIDFLGWTVVDNLSHAKFIALRDDKDPSKVRRET
jgi:DNA ligase D-like protein (predicted ligase)